MHSRLQAFMFKLGRDHLPGGVIESLVQDMEKVPPNERQNYAQAAYTAAGY